uniref:Resolvase, N terminal domain protein n=1 Tax=Rhizobium rhizogenes TaxID=359 RepID=A0A7S4ZUE5_RHIRH|nr:resolvase, N terminal domain protein [Rhizobium rhizogenes]
MSFVRLETFTKEPLLTLSISVQTPQKAGREIDGESGKGQSPPLQQKLIGYVRVSTEDQLNDAQVNELRAAGCHRIHQEHGSGASRARPVLTKLLKDLSAGDVLVVVRLDRLARSVSHLFDVIEDLEKRGVHFRSLRGATRFLDSKSDDRLLLR